MNRNRLFIPSLFLCMYFLLAACSPAATQPPAIPTPPAPIAEPFAIYLSDQPDQPLVSTADIVAYSSQTHAVRLTPAAYEKVAQIRVPTSGLAFQARVGGETIYSGALWPLYSSQSYDGVVIKVPLVPHSANGLDYALSITLGYPGGDFFQGLDPRSDPRILKALAQAGKLQ